MSSRGSEGADALRQRAGAERALKLDGVKFLSAQQAVAVYSWIDETVKRDDKSFLGLRVDPKAFFDGDHADVDGDGAFSRVELVGALRDAFQPSDLRRHYNEMAGYIL